jgi:phage terminase small subunit
MSKDQLTPQELVFVEAYLTGETAGNAYRSALKAGFAEGAARSASRDLLKRRRIMLEVDERVQQMRKQFVSGVITESERIKKILLKIANDENAPATARVAAANSLLDRAGLTRTHGIDLNVEPERDWEAMAQLLDEPDD